MNDEFQLNFDENGEITSKTNKRGGLLGVIPRKLRIVASIVLTTIIVILLLNFFKPQAQKRAIPETIVRVEVVQANRSTYPIVCLLYTSPSPRDLSTSRMPSSA